MPPKIPCDIVFIPSILNRYKEGGYREQGVLFIGRLQSSLNFLCWRMRLVWSRVSSRVPLARKFSRYRPAGGLDRWLKLLLLLKPTVFGRIVSRVFACHYIIQELILCITTVTIPNVVVVLFLFLGTSRHYYVHFPMKHTPFSSLLLVISRVSVNNTILFSQFDSSPIFRD